MTAVQTKIVRDVWRERMRSVAVILAIAVGIAGFTAVLSAYAILTRELRNGFLATNPPSATLHTNFVDPDTVAAVRSSGLVAAAEPRRVLTGHIKTGPMEWRTLSLFVVQDFRHISIAKIQQEEGAWPPAPGEMLIERSALAVAHAKPGDVATLNLPGHPEQHLRVAGTVHDFGLAQARMENTVYGYIGAGGLEQMGEDPRFDALTVIVNGDRFDEQHIRSVADQIKALLERRGHPVQRIDIPPPGKHPHADLMGVLLLSMSAFGFALLLLSGILVVNLLAALMAAHVREIGMMKALGASRWQISSIYFSEVTLFGLAALVIALPTGLLAGRVLCQYLAVFLNFDMTSFAIPLWVYLLVLLSAIGVPLAAAAYPILRGSAITVREAISDFGTGANTFGSTAFDKFITSFGGRFRLSLMVVRNTLRRRRRFLLTVLTLLLSGLAFMSALNFRASLIQTLDRSFASKRYDLWVSLEGMVPISKLESSTRGVQGITHAEEWTVADKSLVAQENSLGPAALGAHSPSEGSSDGRFTVIGLPPKTSLVKMEMLSGRPLNPQDTDAIVVNTSLVSRQPELSVGDNILLRIGSTVARWHVVGITREPFAPATAYVSRDRLNELRAQVGLANSLRIAVETPDHATLTLLRANLDGTLEATGARAAGSATKADARYGFDQHMLMIYLFLLITSGLIAIIGGLGLMTSTTLNVIERQREIGVLRAIGATTRIVSLTVIAESVLTALVSWIAATVLAWPVSKMLGDWIIFTMFQTDLDFRFDPRGPLVWLVLSLAVAVAASVIPAIRISRVTIRQALVVS
jgi:putative ABC transport system permease protein